jgi:hypothetical protein
MKMCTCQSCAITIVNEVDKNLLIDTHCLDQVLHSNESSNFHNKTVDSNDDGTQVIEDKVVNSRVNTHDHSLLDISNEFQDISPSEWTVTDDTQDNTSQPVFNTNSGSLMEVGQGPREVLSRHWGEGKVDHFSGLENVSGFRVKKGITHQLQSYLPQVRNNSDSRGNFISFIQAHDAIVQSGVPNFRGCRIPVPSKLNIPLWRSLLEGYHDDQLVEQLQFGFPVGYTADQLPISDIRNHAGATDHADYVTRYIEEEISLGVMAGPFASNPFNRPLHISPLNTVPKKDPTQRRVIADLSFPSGMSVNDGIPKDTYLDQEITLSFPTVDTLAQHIRETGPQAMLFKKDLKRAYRQFPIDPGDAHLLGYLWQGALYVDLALVMGIRSAAYLCQRATSALGHIYHGMGFRLINYIDDLAVCINRNVASEAYQQLGHLLAQLGVKEAEDKSCPPARSMEFLGIQFDIDDMTMSVTPDRLIEIDSLIDKWLVKRRATKRQLQSLVGKLQFVAKCVRAGRIFISRLLSILPTLRHQHHRFHVSAEFKKDLLWWKRFLRTYNGVSVIPEIIWSAPDAVLSTDSCLTGFGGWCGKEFFAGKFPASILSDKHNINTLELLTVMVALKLWSHYLADKRIEIICDNMVSVNVLNAGRTKDPMLLAILREITFICATVNCQVKACHIPGQDNRLADDLSRAHLAADFEARLDDIVDRSWKQVQFDDFVFNFINDL